MSPLRLSSAPRSGTGSTNPPTTSTRTCQPGSGSTTMNDLTAATAPEDDYPPPSTAPTGPTSSNRGGWSPDDIIQSTYTVWSKRGPQGLDRKCSTE